MEKSQLQFTMTKPRQTKRAKVRIKSVLATILIFLFAFIFIAVLISIKKKNLIYEGQCFYFVCVDSSYKQSNLSSQKTYVQNLGGAGNVYKDSGKFYLVAGAYIAVENAEEIKNNLKVYFTNSSVLSVKTKAVSKNSQRLINKNKPIKDFVEYLYKYVRDFQDYELNYFLSNTSDAEFIKQLISERLKLESLYSGLEENSDFETDTKEYAGLFLLQLTSFLNNFYITSNKQSYVSDYFVTLISTYAEFYSNL